MALMNKRADVSITILVIGVFGVCAFAIISFILYNQQNQQNFVNAEIFENLSSQVENYYFYVNSGLSSQQAAQDIGAQLQGTQLILNAVQKTPSPGSKTIISVQYIVDLSK
jgi:hypothetical protein